MKIMNNEKYIWDYLSQTIKNPYGVAAIMGNLMAESSLNPKNVTGKNAPTNDAYVTNVDTFKINMDQFAHDGFAFGLVQWRYWSRKKSMYQIWQMQRADTSIADLKFQLEFLLFEIEQYKAVWKAVNDGNNIREISDIVMLKYERPGTMSETAKKKRANYAQKYYDKYASNTNSVSISEKAANNLLEQLKELVKK